MGGFGFFFSLSLCLSAPHTYSDSQRDRRELENITVAQLTFHNRFQIFLELEFQQRYVTVIVSNNFLRQVNSASVIVLKSRRSLRFQNAFKNSVSEASELVSTKTLITKAFLPPSRYLRNINKRGGRCTMGLCPCSI